MGLQQSCSINRDQVRDLATKVAKEFAEDFLAAFNDTMIVSNMSYIVSGADDIDKSFINDHFFRVSESTSLSGRVIANQANNKADANNNNSNNGNNSNRSSVAGGGGGGGGGEKVRTSSIDSFGNASITSDDLASARTYSIGDKNAMQVFSQWKLQPSPIPFNVIKRGILIKRGGKFKTFHKRWFHAMNKNHNYVIVYSSDRAGTNIKGAISCLGYSVKPFSAEDVKDIGRAGFKLVHQDSRQREWIFVANNEVEQLQWMEVFAYACRKTVQTNSSTTNGHLLQYIFQLAFHKTRASYGYFDYCNLYGSEKGNLVNFIMEVVESNVFDDYIQSYSSGRGSITTKDLVTQRRMATEISRDIVVPVVELIWTQRCLPTWASRNKLDLPKSMLTGYFITKDVLEKSVSKGISGIILPVIRDIEAKSIRPLITLCMDNVTAAYKEAISSFRTEILTIINGRIECRADGNVGGGGGAGVGGEEGNIGIVSGISNLSNRLEHIFDSPLDETKRILLQMHNVNLAPSDVTKEIFQNTYCSRYDIYLVFLDNIRSLYRNALHSFTQCLVDAVYSSAPSNHLAANSNFAVFSSLPRSQMMSVDKSISPHTMTNAINRDLTSEGNSDTSSPPAHESTFQENIDLLLQTKSAGNDEKLSSMFAKNQYAKLNAAIGDVMKKNPETPIYKLLVSTLMDVQSRFAEDSVKSIKLTFLSIINTIIYSNVQEYVVNPCYDIVCASVKKLGKKLEHVKYINLFYLCGNISDRIISEFILEIIDPYVSNIAGDVRISDLGSMNSFISSVADLAGTTDSIFVHGVSGLGDRPLSLSIQGHHDRALSMSNHQDRPLSMSNSTLGFGSGLPSHSIFSKSVINMSTVKELADEKEDDVSVCDTILSSEDGSFGLGGVGEERKESGSLTLQQSLLSGRVSS